MTDQSESVGARLRDAHKVRAAVRYLADEAHAGLVLEREHRLACCCQEHRTALLHEVAEAQAHLGGLLDKIDEIDNDIARLADEDLQRCGGNGRG